MLDNFQNTVKFIQSMMATSFSDSTYHKIRQTVHSFLESSQAEKEFRKEKIKKYSIELFDNSLEHEDVKQLLMAASVSESASDSFSFLNLSKIEHSFQEKIKSTFIKMSFDITVPEDACYSDIQTSSYLKDSIAQKDFISIIIHLEPYYGNRTFIDSMNGVGNFFCRLLWDIDKDFLIQYITKNEWSFKTELVLFTLRNHSAEIIPHLMQEQNLYPLFRLLMSLIDNLDCKFKQKQQFSFEDIPDYTNIFIEFTIKHNDVFQSFVRKSRLHSSLSFIYLFGWSVAKDQKILKDYLPFISFHSSNQNEAFSQGYIKHANANNIHNDSWTIINHWVSNSTKRNNPINLLSGFESLFINGLAFDFKEKHLFLNKMKKLLDNIELLQYSWNNRNYREVFSIVFYLALANKQKKFQFSDDEMQKHFAVLYDKRYEVLFGHYIIEVITQMLKKPEDVKQITFKDSSYYDCTLNFG